MELHLYAREVAELKQLLQGPYASTWPLKNLLEKIEAGELIYKIQENCKHTPASYKGMMWCCGKCGRMNEPGEGFYWKKTDKYIKYDPIEMPEPYREPQQEKLL